MDFVIQVDHKAKLKEKEMRDKYLDFARELKKLWIMRVTVIPSVISTLRTVHKGLEKGLDELEIEGQIEAIQTGALLRSDRIMGPGDLSRLVVTQILVKNRQLALV